MFMVLPAAFGVFGHEVTGRADPGIRAFTTGCNEPQSTTNLTYNIDEFDEQTVTGWTEKFNRILVALLSEPDRPWREVVGVAA
jgi:hypothetical protein